MLSLDKVMWKEVESTVEKVSVALLLFVSLKGKMASCSAQRSQRRANSIYNMFVLFTSISENFKSICAIV